MFDIPERFEIQGIIAPILADFYPQLQIDVRVQELFDIVPAL